MADDAWVEQGRCLKRVFVQKVGSDKLALHFCELRMGREGVFHFGGAFFEMFQQVPMPAFEILEHVRQLQRCGFAVELKDPVDDMVGACLVGGLRSLGSVAGLKGRTTTRAGSGRSKRGCR